MDVMKICQELIGILLINSIFHILYIMTNNACVNEQMSLYNVNILKHKIKLFIFSFSQCIS